MRESHVLISVMVSTYNRAEMLEDALQSLLHQRTNGKFSFEIIVVDNASTDQSLAVFEKLEKEYPSSLRYAYEESKGVAHARNRGIKEARGEWLAFFDDDQLAEEDWLEQLYEVAIQTGASIVGGRVRLDLPSNELKQLGKVCRKVLRENNFYKVVHQYEDKKLPGTGNVLVERKVFDSIGLFDATRVSGVDWEFFLRARGAGINMIYAPRAVIRHRILPGRLTPKYFRWNTLHIGASLAYLDCKSKGKGKMVFFLVARVGQAMLINGPLWLIAAISRNSKEMLDRKCLLWQAIGYVRRGLFFLSPKLFAQEDFFLNFNVRKARKIEDTSNTEPENSKFNVF